MLSRHAGAAIAAKMNERARKDERKKEDKEERNEEEEESEEGEFFMRRRRQSSMRAASSREDEKEDGKDTAEQTMIRVKDHKRPGMMRTVTFFSRKSRRSEDGNRRKQ